MSGTAELVSHVGAWKPSICAKSSGDTSVKRSWHTFLSTKCSAANEVQVSTESLPFRRCADELVVALGITLALVILLVSSALPESPQAFLLEGSLHRILSKGRQNKPS